MNQTDSHPFKRLPLGTTFTCKRGTFRKVSGSKVFAVKPNGRGETHRKLSFPRNTYCTVL